jgi:hypothetical protein
MERTAIQALSIHLLQRTLSSQQVDSMKRSKRLSKVRLQAILPCPPRGRLIALEETTLTGTGANIFIFSPLDVLSVKSHKILSPTMVSDHRPGRRRQWVSELIITVRFPFMTPLYRTFVLLSREKSISH